MRKSKFSERQVVAILKEENAGLPQGDVSSTATYYKWKSKNGGLEASDLNRIKELEAQLSEFKQIVSDLTLKNNTMKGLIAKNL